ncbi:MAG: hypothetical protein KTR32_15315 [Granulosicoccus sp.]|nr:hypothetical protein [Granulosicoccus sp.]
MNTQSLRDINMLWIGDSLGPVEQLSIRSYLAAGHVVNLFTFGFVHGVPEHTTTLSANEYMTDAEYRALQHRKSGSFSLAADLFRYRLLLNDAGFWSDSDFVCIRPVDLPGDNVFGWESETHIANGFLYLRPESPVLKSLLEYFQSRKIPPWLSSSKRRKLWLKKALGLPMDPANLPWGSFGPRALTWLASQHGVAEQGQPVERFYAHKMADAERIFEKDYRPQRLQSTDIMLVHLWNERIRSMKTRVPEPGSILAEYYERFGTPI